LIRCAIADGDSIAAAYFAIDRCVERCNMQRAAGLSRVPAPAAASIAQVATQGEHL
jgi:hypothetical protein